MCGIIVSIYYASVYLYKYVYNSRLNIKITRQLFKIHAIKIYIKKKDLNFK